MPNILPPPAFIPMRRQDRAITDESWIRNFLAQAAYGVLGTSANDQPYLHISLFALDEARNALYLHSARQGARFSNMLSNPAVSFCVAEMGRLLPAASAKGMSVEFASVIVFGKIMLIDDEKEAIAGLQLLLDKYFPHLQPGPDYRTIQDEESAETAVYRIDIAGWSAKQKKAPPEFPGAFYFNAASKAP